VGIAMDTQLLENADMDFISLFIEESNI